MLLKPFQHELASSLWPVMTVRECLLISTRFSLLKIFKQIKLPMTSPWGGFYKYIFWRSVNVIKCHEKIWAIDKKVWNILMQWSRTTTSSPILTFIYQNINGCLMAVTDRGFTTHSFSHLWLGICLQNVLLSLIS